MELATALEFAKSRREGILTTLRVDGRAQLSNIFYRLGDDGLFRISVTDTRAKTRNLRRDPRAALHVGGDNFWAYVVLDATAELSAVAAHVDDAVVDELVEMYRSFVGEHPNWGEFRRDMVADQRLVLRLFPTSAYGQIDR
jgi:PPOX class probable F420-dependent enzyme